MKIRELLAGMTTITQSGDLAITGLCCDSRQVKQGNCFIALQGQRVDGRDYIPEALQKGATLILIDKSLPYSVNNSSVPVIAIQDLNIKMAELAARFYNNPSEHMTTIGVTGTNGKTSITQYIAMLMQASSQKCGVIGTLGYGFPGDLRPVSHTTCDPIVLQGQLAEIYRQGARAVSMEVSSHALEQHRAACVDFDIAVFTNLTRDHLDYHKSMENYAAAKRKLFYMPSLKYAILNTDDALGLQLAKELKGKLEVYCYGMQPNSLNLPMLQATNVHLNNRGSTAKILSPWGEAQLKSKLLGRFNISNLLAVIIALQLLEIPIHDSLELITHLATVPGRMQVFGGGKLPLVVVDYAHTPDALMQVLMALREHTHGKLWCLFGCGGDRDAGKRPLMGQIAERFSDQLVITDDNPRTEDPTKIVADIMNGLLCPWAVEIEHDRGAAIAHVISCAQAGDVVLVAGKGHENYQLIATEKVLFSDSDHVQAQLRLRQKNAI